jgi:anti-sigma B factor antagonist
MTDFAVTRIVEEPDVAVFAVSGELDISNGRDLKTEIWSVLDAGALRIVLDLTETTFLDSTAIGIIIAANKRLRPIGGSLAIVNVADSIARTFAITGLDEMLLVVPTRNAALAALTASA